MIIGIDIGGTEIKAGIVFGNKVLKKVVVRTGKTRKEIIKNILNSVEALFDKKVKAIVVGCPGPADYKKGVIGDTPNLPLRGINLKKIISKKFRKKVLMQNDAGCFVLGEAIRLGKKDVVGLTLGSGVGGGIVINGRLYTGKGNAGHIGHCTIKFDGPKLGFNQGSLESYVSAKAIKRDYGKEPKDLSSRKAWDEIGMKIGAGVANLINTFDPEAVVLGGGISKSFDLFKRSMHSEIKKRAIRNVPVVRGNENSGILGAALIAQRL